MKERRQRDRDKKRWRDRLHVFRRRKSGQEMIAAAEGIAVRGMVSSYCIAYNEQHGPQVVFRRSQTSVRIFYILPGGVSENLTLVVLIEDAIPMLVIG